MRHVSAAQGLEIWDSGALWRVLNDPVLKFRGAARKTCSGARCTVGHTHFGDLAFGQTGRRAGTGYRSRTRKRAQGTDPDHTGATAGTFRGGTALWAPRAVFGFPTCTPRGKVPCVGA